MPAAVPAIVAGMAARHRPHRRRGAADRRLGEIGGMGVAGRLAGDRAQPEPLRRVEAGTLDTAVVERQALGLAVFEKELAVVHSGQRLGDDRLDPPWVHAGALEEQFVRDSRDRSFAAPLVLPPIWSPPPASGRRIGSGIMTSS